LDAIKKGKVQLVFMSPESLLGNDQMDAVYTKSLCGFVVDEAHRVRMWQVDNH